MSWRFFDRKIRKDPVSRHTIWHSFYNSVTVRSSARRYEGLFAVPFSMSPISRLGVRYRWISEEFFVSNTSNLNGSVVAVCVFNNRWKIYAIALAALCTIMAPACRYDRFCRHGTISVRRRSPKISRNFVDVSSVVDTRVRFRPFRVSRIILNTRDDYEK